MEVRHNFADIFFQGIISFLREEILQDIFGMFELHDKEILPRTTEQVRLFMNLPCHVNTAITKGNQIFNVNQRGGKNLFNLSVQNQVPGHDHEIENSKDDCEDSSSKEEGEECGGDMMSDSSIKSFTREEWKVLSKAVEGVSREVDLRSSYKGTNKGKSKKGIREIRKL